MATPQRLRLRRRTANALLALGFVIIAVNAPRSLLANVTTGQGTLIATMKPASTETLAQGFFLSSDPADAPNLTGRIAFGALCILMGFWLHALVVIHSDNRTVPVKAVKRRKTMQETAVPPRKREVILIERVIRI